MVVSGLLVFTLLAPNAPELAQPGHTAASPAAPGQLTARPTPRVISWGVSMFERDIDPGFPDAATLRRPRMLLSRRHAVLLLVAGYVFAVVVAALLFGTVELTQGYDDSRNIDATLIFAAVLALPFGLAMFNIGRNS